MIRVVVEVVVVVVVVVVVIAVAGPVVLAIVLNKVIFGQDSPTKQEHGVLDHRAKLKWINIFVVV